MKQYFAILNKCRPGLMPGSLLMLAMVVSETTQPYSMSRIVYYGMTVYEPSNHPDTV